MIIFRTDGNSISKDTTDLEQFSVYEPDTWRRFENTGHYKYLEELSLYIPEKYYREYNKAFKDYMSRLHKDVYYPGTDYEDEIRETRKKA
jgi:hypothetical protein